MEEKESGLHLCELLGNILRELDHVRGWVSDFSSMHKEASSHDLNQLVLENAALRLQLQMRQSSTEAGKNLGIPPDSHNRISAPASNPFLPSFPGGAPPRPDTPFKSAWRPPRFTDIFHQMQQE